MENVHNQTLTHLLVAVVNLWHPTSSVTYWDLCKMVTTLTHGFLKYISNITETMKKAKILLVYVSEKKHETYLMT